MIRPRKRYFSGRRWRRVACTAFSNSTPGYSCSRPSGISLGGDKADLVFKGARSGWLTVDELTGAPNLNGTANGGTSWQRQPIRLSGEVVRPTRKDGPNPTYSFGTLLPPAPVRRMVLIPGDVPV